MCRCIGHSLDLNQDWHIALFQSVAHWLYLKGDLSTLFSEGYALGLLRSDCYKKTLQTEEILCTSVHLNLLKRHKHQVHMTQGLEISHPAAFCLEPLKLHFYS